MSKHKKDNGAEGKSRERGTDAIEVEAANPSKADKKAAGGTGISRESIITIAIVGFVTLANAGLAGFGIKILNDALEHKKEAEKSAREARDVAAAASESHDVIIESIRSSYFLHDLHLKREILHLFVELPGVELPGKTKDSTVEQFRRGLDAVQALERYVPPNKHTKTKHFVNAFLEFNSHQFEKAIESINQFPDEIPEKYLLLGTAYMRSGADEKDTKTLKQGGWAFKKARDLSRRTRTNTVLAKSHLNHGIVLGMEGRFDDAELSFQRALKLDSGLYLVHFNLGALYSQTGNFEKAVSSLCSFHVYSETDVIDAIESDLDNTFEPLKQHLGADWTKTLSNRLYAC